MKRAVLLTGCIVAALSSPALSPGAWAQEPDISLRDQPTSHGGSVTLGDIFDGLSTSAAIVVVAHAAPPGLDTVIEAETAQMAAHRAGFNWPNEKGYHRISVVSEEGPPGPPPAPAPVAHARSPAKRHGAAAGVLTYARNIAAGDIISASDLVFSSDAVAPEDTIADPDAAIGKSARHALRAGAPAAVRDLIWPKVIKRDDLISVAFEEDGVNLTLEAKAMGDASVGDNVEVTNLQSKKVIEAVCIGPGQAVVGPRAEAIKTASYQPGGPSRLYTASLH
jgi:flagella basal body P-ring formation protein FlgA